MDALNSYKGLNRQALMDVIDSLSKRMRNMNFADGGLRIGQVSKTKVNNANSLVCAVNGQFVTVTTADTFLFTATTHDIPANASTVQEAMYVFTIDDQGAGHVYMGEIATGSGNAKLPNYEDLPEDEAIVGALRLAVSAGATSFDATTDELDEAHLTDTYYDYASMFPLFSAEQ